MKKTILISTILVAAALLLANPVSAAANNRTYAINLNGRTAIGVWITDGFITVIAAGDIVIKLPNQRAQLVTGYAALGIDPYEGEVFTWIGQLQPDEFSWSMSQAKVEIHDPQETNVTWIAMPPPLLRTHMSIDLGEILGIPELNLVIRCNAVATEANAEAVAVVNEEGEIATFTGFGLIAIGTVNIVFTLPPPS